MLGLPRVSFDPDGDALLEWRWSSDRSLDLSVGGNGELRYAARVGSARVTGIEPFAEASPTGLQGVVRRLARRVVSARRGGRERHAGPEGVTHENCRAGARIGDSRATNTIRP